MPTLHYINNPIFCHWFGPEVTLARAVICVLSAVLNVGILFGNMGPIVSAWDWIAAVIFFPIALFAAACFGAVSWAVGWFLAVLISALTTSSIEEDSRRHAAVVVQEWTINIFFILAEVFVVYYNGARIVWLK